MKNKRFVLGEALIIVALAFSGCQFKGSTDEVASSQMKQTEEIDETAQLEDQEKDEKKVQEEPNKETQTQEAAHNENPKNIDGKQIYREVLEEVYQSILQGGEQEDETALIGVLEVAKTEGVESALEHVGYMIQDLNGDQIPELMIGARSDECVEDSYGNQIFAVYTYYDEQPYRVFDGGYRNCYYWMGEGKFFNVGSAGALYAIFGTYSLSNDGKELLASDYYFTHEKDGDFNDIWLYHNTTGDWDTNVSEAVEQSQDAIDKLRDELARQVKQPELIPFASFTPTGEEREEMLSSKLPINVEWADDKLSSLKDYHQYYLDQSEMQVKLLFSTTSHLEDFKLLALTFKDIDDKGNMQFAAEERYLLESLDEDYPLVVGMTFYGDLPCYGISYIDEGGTIRQYAITQSGEDGSLLLEPIIIAN